MKSSNSIYLVTNEMASLISPGVTGVAISSTISTEAAAIINEITYHTMETIHFEKRIDPVFAGRVKVR